ncbi:hypothetical protein [Pedobacter sp.]
MKTSEEELIQHTKSVFEDYNDGFADHGWAELRKKYPEKERKLLPIWWLTGVAATLLIVVGLYFNDTFEKQHVKLKVQQVKGKTRKDADVTAAKQEEAYAKSKPHKNEKNTLGSDIPASRKNTPTIKNSIARSTYLAKNSTLKSSGAVPKTMINNATAQHIDPVSPIKNTDDQSGLLAVNSTTQDSVVIEKSKAAINYTTTVPPSEKKSTEEFLKDQSKLLAHNEKNKDKKNQSKTTFEVFTGTFFNYHDNNEAKLSAGLGLNANIEVAKNLVLSVGAGISQNKVSYENKVPAEVTQSMFAARDVALSLAPSNAPYSATATNDVNFNGRLLSIDLPIAFKFFPTKRQDFYISTGINSSTYLSQKYTYNYNLSNFGIQNGAAQAKQQTEESNLGGFDFANNAIIAVGFNQTLGKNILIFEPYYKPALNTMGNKNLRISSAGINLKFNFNGSNKK